METKSRAAFRELIATLQQVEAEWVGPEWGVATADDTARAHRQVMHMLEGGLFSHFESDPDRPDWRRIVSPTRKFTGDNADAVYFECPLNAQRAYRIRGNTAGAVYTSFTIEAGAQDGRYATRTCGIIRDSDIDIAPDGSYEIYLGGAARDRNWLALDPDASRITTRHYFDQVIPAAAEQNICIPLSIEPLDPPGPPAPWTDERTAAGIQRVINYVRGKTVDQPRPGARPSIAWLSDVPNVFPKPQVPGNMAFAAFDAAYSMTPFEIAGDEAMIITGRWPRCRFANLCIWNRFGQTLDYVHRRTSASRANTTLEPDGSFRLVLAHRDPQQPNWLDLEGHTSGSLFFRFFLPEEEVETPVARMVKFSDLAK